jgi:hypothetical protein
MDKNVCSARAGGSGPPGPCRDPCRRQVCPKFSKFFPEIDSMKEGVDIR